MARPPEPYRRETILRAAVEVFLEQGYSEARLADIAKRAGVVVSTLYLYFDSKEAMVRAIAQQMQQHLVDQLAPLLIHLKDKDDVRQFIETVFLFARDHRDEFSMLHLDSGLRSVHIRKVQAERGPRFQVVLQALDQLMAEGHIRQYDPTRLIDMLNGFVRWMMMTLATLEEEEQEPFKAFCTQWLCNALLRDSLH